MSKTRCLVSASSAALVVSGFMLAVPLVGWAQLEEIIVTTRKKTENLQDVPIAVDAISAEQIERQGISRISDITKLSTSVQFDQSFGPQDIRIAVRGLSNTRGRSNVAFLIDGVDVTTENFISAGSGLLANQRLLTDVERIEIVKGPQSALYGRAAFAGAIAYTTKDVGDELEGEVRVEAGNYGVMQVDGSVGGPVVGLEDVLGVRVSGAYWKSDGFYTNATTGNPLGDEDGWGTALTAVWTPTDDVKVKLRTEYSDAKYGLRPSVRIGGGIIGRNQEFFEYPVDPDLIQGTSFTATKLSDFGQFCPEELKDPTKGDGICQSTHFGGASGLQPALDVDPSTGTDYKGTTTQLFRTTLNASIDYEFGTFTSITGFTDYEATDELDQDYQTFDASAAAFGIDWSAHMQGRSALETDQFSQELRFATAFDGPLNFTLGGLYWHEDRAQDDLNYIISCIEYGKAGVGVVWPDPAAFVSGICDGENGTITDWQDRHFDQFPCLYDDQGDPIPATDPDSRSSCVQGPRTPSPWRATTEHWSAYLNIAWDLSDTFQLTLENRYVNEDFDILRPNFSSCSSLFFPFGLDPGTAPGRAEGDVIAGAEDIVCTAEKRLNPNIPAATLDPQGNNWTLIEGSQRSSFNTPKITLNWQPTDSATYYFSWGKGIKPGGINTLAAGGSATTINDERFESEEVQAWELGWKTDWEVGGFLRFNGALFFNDYTDKQIGTQIVSPLNDQLQPRVINIGGAEVWGLELEAIWQPEFLEGLVLSANYTYLDATFTDFKDTTRSMVRAAQAGECNIVTKDGQPWQSVEPAFRFCEIDLTGNRLERTPENAFVGNFQYTAQFMESDFDWFWEGTVTFEDERFLNADNANAVDSYWLADTRIGLTGEKFEFLVYINNLLDDDTIQTGGTGPDFAEQVTELGFTSGFGASQSFALLPDPRTFGARLTMRF